MRQKAGRRRRADAGWRKPLAHDREIPHDVWAFSGRGMARPLWLLLILVLTVGRASADPASDRFRLGYSFETGKRYSEALDQYRQAVKLTNTALAGRIARQMGNCYYYLGVSGNAVLSYEYYLRYFPNDAAVKNLVVRLKGAPKAVSAKEGTSVLPPREYTHPMQATWRSLLIPGWGQWKRGDGWAGLTYLSLTLGSFGAGRYFDSVGNQAWESYKKATTSADATKFFEDAKSADGLYNACQYALATTYCVNLVDALFLTMLKNPPKPTAPRARADTSMLAVAPLPGGAVLTWIREF